MAETNWARLFGTPERAAETLYEVCGEEFSEWCPMDSCPMFQGSDDSAYGRCKLLDGAAAYLREEAE